MPARRTQFHWAAAYVAAVALLLGGLIYLLFRSPNLRMFHWVERVAMAGPLFEGRTLAAAVGQALPPFVRYSVPDGLWLLSMLAAIDAIWSHRPAAALRLCCLMAAGSLSSELAQVFWPGMGTFDWRDLVALGAASVYCGVPARRRDS